MFDMHDNSDVMIEVVTRHILVAEIYLYIAQM